MFGLGDIDDFMQPREISLSYFFDNDARNLVTFNRWAYYSVQAR
jgi:hypothetical protein